MYCLRSLLSSVPGHPMSHCSSICKLAGGDLLVTWYAATFETHPDEQILLARLPRGSFQWTEPQVVVDTPGKADGNPIIFTAPDGSVHLYYVTLEGEGWSSAIPYGMTSSDEGRTWSEPRMLSDQLGVMFRNKPLFLPSGRVLLPIYGEQRNAGGCWISDDGCATWRKPPNVMEAPGGCIQPTLAFTAEGQVIAFLRSRNHTNVWRFVSDDEGETWSPCQATELPNNDSGTDVAMLPDGRFVLAFNNCREGRTPLTLAVSEDGGLTWPLKYDVERADGEFSYPAVLVSDESLHLTYTFLRRRIAYFTCDLPWLLEHCLAPAS